LRSIYSYWKIKDLTSKMCSIIEKKSDETKIIINTLVKEVKEIKLKNDKTKTELHIEENKEFNWGKLIQNAKNIKNDNCANLFVSIER
jgi:hypothetical protein